MYYKYKYIENKWYKKHKKLNFFKINKKKKFYILNMFPYPSGYGLHIGHSIGYIFSDIISKYKSSMGYKILNPIGFDSFGLPAEQYAIQTGNSPKFIIKKSIKRYIKQIKLLGVFFNWDKMINTCESKFYKWTQWIFLKLFNSYYDNKLNKAKHIKYLIKYFKKKKKWNNKNIIKNNKILNNYRLAYLNYSYVNWCPKLKTVLANDEVYNGRSVRGEYPVIKKKMKQWHLKITKYSDRLIKDLKLVNWPNYIKKSQIKWIGKKKVYFFYIYFLNKKLKIFLNKKNKNIKDIIFNFPSSSLDILFKILKKKYLNKIKSIINNFKLYKILIIIKNKINIYISNFYEKNKNNIKNIYVNFKKDKKFNNIKINLIIKNLKIKKIYFNFNFKKIKILNLNDIVFSRQRYWGEPIPIYYDKNNIPKKIKSLPLKLPIVKKDKFLYKKFKLSKCTKWAWDKNNKKIVNNKLININKNIYPIDINTMPSFAASNWYYLRYIDPKYTTYLVNKNKLKYWGNVDLYIGGVEHVNGHLLYSRFCNKFLNDIKVINFKEPYKKFINQGIILNYTYCIYKILHLNKIISYDLINNYDSTKLQKIYINEKFIYYNNLLNIKKFNSKFKKFKLIYNVKFICEKKLEKMSKSKNNVIIPDNIINKYGIDCYRLYLIFLGPFNKNKIWNICKINGVKRFLNKIWNFYQIKNNINNNNNNNNKKINLYIKKIHNNYKKFYLHKNISIFMKILNLLKKNKIYDLNIKKKFLIILSPYIPYITEELWLLLGNKKSIFYEKYPKYYDEYLIYNKYIIMINNKKKDIIYTKKNKLNALLKKIKNKKYFINIKNRIKKYIFIKKKILNILF